MGDLERLAATDQDPGLRPASRPDHDGGRGGEAHRARTRDDDDADEGRQRERERAAPARTPATRGTCRRRRRGRSGRRPRRSDRRVAGWAPCCPGPDSRGPTIRASAVSRPTRVARITNVPVVLRVAPMTSAPAVTSTGMASPVSMLASTARAALDDHAVDGHPLARPDAQQVADRHRLERHVLFAPVGHAPGRRWPADQRAAGSPRSCWSWRDARASDRAGRAR